MTESSSSEGYVKLKVIRGSVDSLSLYEITDYELEIFEKGGPSSTYFNLCIALGSIGLAFLATLLTVDISNIKTYLLFLVICVIGLAGGAVLLVLWYRTRSPMKHICQKIRARVPATTPPDVETVSQLNNQIGAAEEIPTEG